MTTGTAGFHGYAPKAIVTERVLLSQLPEIERAPFMAFVGTRYELTGAGEPVFSKKEYETWKQRR
jgi:hypothetical protein